MTKLLESLSNLTLRRPLWFAVALGMFTSIFVSPGSMNIDTVRRLQMAHSWWTKAPEVAPHDDFIGNNLPGADGKMKAQFGTGQSLLLLPADWIVTQVMGEQQSKAKIFAIWMLVFPVLSGALLGYGSLVFKLLGANAAQRNLLVIILQFATSVLVYTHDAQENSLQALLMLMIWYHGLRWAKEGAVWQLAAVSFAAGFALLVRAPLLVVIAPLGFQLLWLNFVHEKRPVGKSLLALLLCGLPIFCAFIVAERFFHHARFGNWTGTYVDVMVLQYARLDPGAPPGFPMDAPMLPGIAGPLITPRKAVWLFDPLLLLFPLASLYAWRAKQALALSSLLAAGTAFLLTLLLYSTSYYWHGDGAWGARHHQVTIVLLLIPILKLVIDRLPDLSRGGRALLAALIAVAALVQMLSLPMFFYLEVQQSIHTGEWISPIALRAANIAAWASGNVAAWGLDFKDPLVAGYFDLRPQFWPFAIAEVLPKWAGVVLIAAWVAAIAGLAFLLYRLSLPWISASKKRPEAA